MNVTEPNAQETAEKVFSCIKAVDFSISDKISFNQ